MKWDVLQNSKKPRGSATRKQVYDRKTFYPTFIKSITDGINSIGSKSTFCLQRAFFWTIFPAFRVHTLGNLIFYQHLTDSPQNQHVFLLFLKIDKSKISKKSNENWSCYKLRTNSFSKRQPASQIWWLSSQAGQNCSTFRFSLIFLKFWI